VQGSFDGNAEMKENKASTKLPGHASLITRKVAGWLLISTQQQLKIFHQPMPNIKHKSNHVVHLDSDAHRAVHAASGKRNGTSLLTFPVNRASFVVLGCHRPRRVTTVALVVRWESQSQASRPLIDMPSGLAPLLVALAAHPFPPAPSTTA